MGITTIARGTIAGTIATTTVGKERARSNPGFFFAWVTAPWRGCILRKEKISIQDGVGDNGAAFAAIKP
jgi:hypothetical protein